MKFEDFCENTVIAFATFNRKKITEICLSQISKTKNNASLWVYDDHSTEMDQSYIKSIAPDAEFFMPPQKLGINKLRFVIHNDVKLSKFKFVYHTDNDAYHDPNWIKKLYELYKEHKMPISLYNTKHHFKNTIEEKKLFSIRKQAPGISFFYDISSMPNIEKHTHPNWDISFSQHVGRFIVTNQSYVEHFGANGIHNKDYEKDRAENPTEWLVAERSRILKILK